MLIYNSTLTRHEWWDGSKWQILAGAGGSVDYPNFSWKEARDHFARTTFEPTNAMDAYSVGNATFGIYTLADNEFFEHAAIQTADVATANAAFLLTQEYTIWHTKNDKDNSFTKATLEFRAQFTRLASMNIALGASRVATSTNDISALVDKIIIGVLGTGNFFGRVSQGTAESTLDMGVSDNSVHKFRIEWTSTQVQFFLDGVSKGTIITNLPNRTLSITPIWIFNNTGIADGIDQLRVDYWHAKME